MKEDEERLEKVNVYSIVYVLSLTITCVSVFLFLIDMDSVKPV